VVLGARGVTLPRGMGLTIRLLASLWRSRRWYWGRRRKRSTVIAQAVQLAGGRLGEIASMRRNLLLLADRDRVS